MYKDVIGGFVVGAVMLFGMAVFGGTIVWLLWPVAIPAAFPGLVASGILAAKLSWSVSVCLTWLVSLLFKSTTTVKEN